MSFPQTSSLHYLSKTLPSDCAHRVHNLHIAQLDCTLCWLVAQSVDCAGQQIGLRNSNNTQLLPGFHGKSEQGKYIPIRFINIALQ